MEQTYIKARKNEGFFRVLVCRKIGGKYDKKLCRIKKKGKV